MQFEDCVKDFAGRQIFCRHLKHSKASDEHQPRCLVFISHGFGEHIGRYESIFQLFQQNHGAYVFGHDHLGHGQSGGERAWIDSFDDYVIPLKLHIEETRSKVAGDETKLFIYGHSMGCVVALKAIEQFPELEVSGVIFEGPAFALPDFVPDWVARFGVFLGQKKLTRRMKLPKGNVSLMSKTAQVVQDYEKDPLAFHGGPTFAFSGFIYDAIRHVSSRAASYSVAMFIGHGSQDRIAPLSASRKFHEASASKDKAIRIFEGARHNLRHEKLNDTEKDFEKSISEWLQNRL